MLEFLNISIRSMDSFCYKKLQILVKKRKENINDKIVIIIKYA